MKKIIIIICILIYSGCSLKNTPTSVVESYLNKYQNNEIDVSDNLDKYLNSTSYTNDQRTKYRHIITKLYQDMKYEIIDEKVNDDKATVEVMIKTYDLYKVNSDSNSYLLENASEFYDEYSSYSESKYIDYLLDKMSNNLSTINNTIIFNLTKENEIWTMSELSENDLMKLHGTFNYE